MRKRGESIEKVSAARGEMAMRVSRRKLLAGVAAVSAATITGHREARADYPERLLKAIVPRAPGGGTDILARLMSAGVQERLKQPFIIENRADASTVIGSSAVAQSAPDGYTFLHTDNAFYQNPAILKNLPYDTLKDFSGVTMLAQAPVILIINADVPAKNLKELIDYARSQPGKISFASGGVGASTHLAGILFNLTTKLDIVHVPFRSSGPAMDALLGGHVTMQFGGISSARAHVESGKLRAIALTGKKRDPAMPEVPTFDELGVSVDIASIWGVHMPAGTPLSIRRKLRDTMVEVMRTPMVSTRMSELGYEIIGNTPEEHDAQTRELVSFWLEVGKKVPLAIN
jgi:tripartite-type tricarboxylate transporter receptor subunit TctC